MTPRSGSGPGEFATGRGAGDRTGAAQARSEIIDLLERHGIRTRKRLGQHFLADPNIVRKIVSFAGVGSGDLVLEIGAGTGTLTRELAAAGCRVLAFEIDRSLRPVLDEVLAPFDDVRIVYADALAAPMEFHLDGVDDDGRWTLVANLPYNIGTPLLLDLLATVPRIERFVVMVQREVADRLAAAPGTPAYGLPSVVVGLHARVVSGFTVPPQVFVPAPEVESAVLAVDRRSADPLAGRAREIAAAAFGQRRKMLRRSLAGVLDDPEAVLDAAGIDPTARPEVLAPADFLRIARTVGD